MLTALACIVLGMGMPVTASYILLAVLVAPALVEAGVSPIAAHMFILYYAMLSFLTPPVCVAVYIAATIAGSRPMETAFESLKMGIVAYLVPFLFVADDALLLAGTSAREHRRRRDRHARIRRAGDRHTGLLHRSARRARAPRPERRSLAPGHARMDIQRARPGDRRGCPRMALAARGHETLGSRCKGAMSPLPRVPQA